MASHTQSEPADQFLTIDETAGLLGIAPSALRQGIACGLVPIRRDNEGALRVHRVEVPDDLLEQIKRTEVDPRLQIESLVDEVSSLRDRLDVADTLRARLQTLLEQQATALERSGRLLDANESNTARFETLLQRAIAAIEKSESLANVRASQLTSTMDKTMQLLDRAVNDAETARTDADRLSGLVDRTQSANTRIEEEIGQRNDVIDKQHELMQRLVSLSEQGAGLTAPKAKRRRTFWQRLWGGGKGI